jgi:hypothetical protein
MEGNVRMLREKVLAGQLSREEAAQMIGKDVFEAQGAVPKIVSSEKLVSPISGKLNPNWVEWLMGYPTGWTDLNN